MKIDKNGNVWVAQKNFLLQKFLVQKPGLNLKYMVRQQT